MVGADSAAARELTCVHDEGGVRVLRLKGQCSPGWHCVSFASYGHDNPPRPFGGSFFNRYRLAATLVVPHANDWYQSPGVAPALAVARTGLDDARLLAYGSSMGGFGALAWADAVGAQRVLALSPQFSIAPDEVGHFENRWRREARRIPEYRRAHVGAAALDGCETVIVYDPFHGLDRLHARLIRDLSPARVHLLPVTGAGHPVGWALAETGLLQPLVFALCSDRPVAEALRACRSAFRATPLRAELVVQAFRRYAKVRGRHGEWAERLSARFGRIARSAAAEQRLTGPIKPQRSAARPSGRASKRKPRRDGLI